MEKEEIINLINKKFEYYDHKRCEVLGDQEEIDKIKAIKSIDELCKYSSTEIFHFLQRAKCEDIEKVNDIAILVDCYNKDTQARRDVVDGRLSNIVSALQSYSYPDYSVLIANLDAGLQELSRLKEIANEDERITPFPSLEQMDYLFSDENEELVNRLKKWILLTNIQIFNRNIIELETSNLEEFDELAGKTMKNIADILDSKPEHDMDELDEEIGYESESLKDDEPIIDDEYIYNIQLDDDDKLIVSSAERFVDDNETAIEALPIDAYRAVTQFYVAIGNQFNGESYEELNNKFNNWIRGYSEKYDRDLLLKASIYEKLVESLKDLDSKYSSVGEAIEMKELVLEDISRALNYYEGLSGIIDYETNEAKENEHNNNVKLVFLAPSYESKSYFEEMIDDNVIWQSPNYKSMLMKLVDSLNSGHVYNNYKNYGNLRLKTCGSDFGLFFRSFENNGVTYVLVGPPTLARDALAITETNCIVPNSVIDDITLRISNRDRSLEDRRLYDEIIKDSDDLYERLKESTEKRSVRGGK